MGSVLQHTMILWTSVCFSCSKMKHILKERFQKKVETLHRRVGTTVSIRYIRCSIITYACDVQVSPFCKIVTSFWNTGKILLVVI